MDLELKGKRVLVTGSSRGIGLSIAEGFLREGARAVLLARTAKPLQEAANRLNGEYGKESVLAYAVDCADGAAFEQVVQRVESVWGGLDIAVANVGDGRGPLSALPDADRFADAWRTNFTAAEATARVSVPLLQASNGSLLFISSIAGLESVGAPTDYAVAKTAVIALAKQLARRLAPQVRVNCIAPGNVNFPGGSWDAKARAEPQRVAALIESIVPMKRFGTPREIADAALFLCSARADFITGACLIVDGGQTVSLI